MRRALRGRAGLLPAIALCLASFLLPGCVRSGADALEGPGERSPETPPELRVLDFVVTNVYWDGLEATRRLYPGIRLAQPENAKFAVLFTRRVEPGEIESIRVAGPGGYALDFEVQLPFDRRRLSGRVDDELTWYMIYDIRGFLREGRYDIVVSRKGGPPLRMGKVLRLNLRLLERYLATGGSHEPRGYVAPDPAGLWLSWPLVEGIDAYYCSRLQEVGKDFATGNLHFDNIFLRRGEAGLNLGRIRVEASLERGKPYVWFTEVLDSNRLSGVDMAIFQEFQFFEVR